MDAKEVQLRGKAILKALADKSPPSDLVNILGELKKGVKPDEALLRSTKIGVTVSKLKVHPDPQVAKNAAELVNIWKNAVKRSGSGNSTPKPQNGTASPAPASASGTPVAQTPKKPKHSVPPEKRSHKTDKVNWEVTGNDIRDRCVQLMYDGLALMSEEMPEDILRIARDVELAAFNQYQPETSEAYKTKFRSLYQNLKNKSNPTLRIRVLSGEITPERFVVMTHDELKSPDQQAIDKALAKENLRKASAPQGEKSMSGTIQCGKCKQYKVSYSQAQTRSADEPMTTFCECTNCGARWKM